MKMKKQVSVGLLSILIAGGLDPLVGVCQTSGLTESSRILNEAVQKNSGEEKMLEGTSVNADSTPSSEAEDTNTTAPKADATLESSEELTESQENLSSQGEENSSEIKEDTANTTTSETAAKGDVNEQNVQPKATENIDDWMPDKTLQTWIADKLKMNVSQVTKNDMLNLPTRLSLDYIGTANLTGLEYAKNITELELRGASIDNQSLDVISKLTALTSLDISNYSNQGQLTTLEPLKNLTQLTFLNIKGNQISDLSPLQNMNIETFWGGDNPYSDVTPLKTSTLGRFDIENTNVEDISILRGKAGYAYFKGAKIADLSPANSYVIWSAENQRVTLPPIYVPNKQPYAVSVEAPIQGATTGVQTLVPQNNGSWTGVYSGDWNSGKVEWSGGNQVPETGDLVSTWSATQKNLNNNNYTFSGTYTQPYILSKATVDAHNSTLYTGEAWTAQDNFDSATDKLGNPVTFNGVQVTGTVDTTQPGKYKITYTCDDAQKEIEVTVLQNQTSVDAHNSTLYTGDSWNAQDNFDGAKDRDGNPVNFQDVQVTGSVDTTQPGKYKVTYSYGGVQKEIEVTVLQNQTSVDAHNSTLYTGDSWNAQDNFDGAKDRDGNPVNFQDVQVTGSVDTTQPGKYKVTYSYGGVQKEIEVTVLQNQTRVDAHDSTLYTGDTWNAQDNFDGAKDRDGNPVNFQDVQVTGTVDTTHPGKYKVTYSYGGVQKEIEVTVLQKVVSNGNDNTANGDNKEQNKNTISSSYNSNVSQRLTSSESERNSLPSTGEKGSVWLLISGVMLFIFASALALLRFNKSK